MKKIIISLLVLFITFTTFAQEKGFHLFLGGNAGGTKYLYTFNDRDGESKFGTGYGGGLGVQYFFTYHVGISLGVDYNIFNTKSYYRDKTFTFVNQTDNDITRNPDGDACDLYYRLINWTEKQRTTFLDIPLMAVFQKKFGKEEMHGIYFGIGLKAQIPLTSDYGKNDGDVRVFAQYHDWNLPLGDGAHSVNLPQHAYGLNDNRNWSGENQIKAGIAITGEFGFLFGLTRRVDLRLGVTADYGLNNYKKVREEFLYPTDVQQTGDFVADKASYSGVLNGNQIGNRVNPLAVKGYLGIRIKFGDLKKKEENPQDLYYGSRGCCLDTIHVNFIIDSNFRHLMPQGMPYPYPASQSPANPYPLNPYPASQYPANPYPASQYPANPYPANPNIPNWYIPDDLENPNDPNQLRNIKDKINAIVDEFEEPIYFDLDKHDLRPRSIEVLDRKVAYMKKYPSLKISLVGHTCDLGVDGHNDILSSQRAKEARMYLISQGISPSRLSEMPMGKNYPTYPNTSEYYRSLNRRVDFRVVDR